MYRLVIEESELADVLDGLQHGQRSVIRDVDILYVAGGAELLVHPAYPHHASAGILLVQSDEQEAIPRCEPDRVLIRLFVNWRMEPSTVRGQVCWRAGTGWEPLDSLRIVGERMRDIPLQGAAFEDDTDAFDFESDERLSRVVGAVGGSETLTALQRLRVAIIGCGGTGSVMADQLARLLGPEGQIDLFDPDRMELPNLAAWSNPRPEDVGKSKADALAGYLRNFPYPPRIFAYDLSIGAAEVGALLKRAHIFVCCVDSPRARIVAGFYAAVFVRPLLVVETGVFLGRSAEEHRKKIISDEAKIGIPSAVCLHGSRMRQADVRLILPQRGACLLCAGGIGGDPDDENVLAPSSRLLNGPEHGDGGPCDSLASGLAQWRNTAHDAPPIRRSDGSRGNLAGDYALCTSGLPVLRPSGTRRRGERKSPTDNEGT